MKTQRRSFLAVSIVTLGMVLAMTIGSRFVHAQHAQTDHVRWDIPSNEFTSPLVTQNAGGEAFAFAYHTPGRG